MANSAKSAAFLIESRLADAAAGDVQALFELGVLYSTGSQNVTVDLIEAHKWFNLAAVAGHADGHACRADISDEMSARDIAMAQRDARSWLQAQRSHAA